MKATLKIVVLLLLVGVAQTVLTRLSPWLGMLDPLMVAAGLFALRLRFVPAVLTGAAAGLVQDSLGGGIVGLHAFTKTAVVAGLTSMGKVLVVRGELAQALVVGMAAVVESIISRLLLAFFGWPGGEPLSWVLGRGIGATLLCGAYLIGGSRSLAAWRRWRRRPALRIR